MTVFLICQASSRQEVELLKGQNNGLMSISTCYPQAAVFDHYFTQICSMFLSRAAYNRLKARAGPPPIASIASRVKFNLHFSVHGDRLQSQREEAVNEFKYGARQILVSPVFQLNS